MPLNLSYSEYITSPLIGGALVYLWDYFNHPYYSNTDRLVDAGCLASSFIITDLGIDLGFSKIYPMESDSAQYKIVEIIGNTWLYYFLFGKFMAGTTRSSTIGLSSSQELVLVAVVVSLLSAVLEVPFKKLLHL